jgi:IS30 family transposase
LTERRSGLHLVREETQRTAAAVCRAIVAALCPLRHHVYTLTSVNGTGFAEHEVTALVSPADHFFAQPYAA